MRPDQSLTLHSTCHTIESVEVPPKSMSNHYSIPASVSADGSPLLSTNRTSLALSSRPPLQPHHSTSSSSSSDANVSGSQTAIPPSIPRSSTQNETDELEDAEDGRTDLEGERTTAREPVWVPTPQTDSDGLYLTADLPAQRGCTYLKAGSGQYVSVPAMQDLADARFFHIFATTCSPSPEPAAVGYLQRTRTCPARPHLGSRPPLFIPSSVLSVPTRPTQSTSPSLTAPPTSASPKTASFARPPAVSALSAVPALSAREPGTASSRSILVAGIICLQVV
jgi:hypothetical protein